MTEPETLINLGRPCELDLSEQVETLKKALAKIRKEGEKLRKKEPPEWPDE